MARITTRGSKDGGGVPLAIPDEYPTMKPNGEVNDHRYWGTVYRATIFLADNEYSSSMGGQLMDKLADEFLRNYYRSQTLPNGALSATCKPLEVEVVEHGGWSLTYALKPTSDQITYPQWKMPLMCISSANDQAQFSGSALAWRQNGYWRDRRIVATVRREEGDELPKLFEKDAVGYVLKLPPPVRLPG